MIFGFSLKLKSGNLVEKIEVFLKCISKIDYLKYGD